MGAAWAWAGVSLVMYLLAPLLVLIVLAPQGQEPPSSGLAILPVAWLGIWRRGWDGRLA
jgi:hypothetical protein